MFGISTPAANALVGTVDPILLAGLLYCGAGIGVAMLRRLAHAVLPPAAREQALRRPDIPWLAGAIAAGGVAGPILLMTGLARTDAAAASLLLTLEGAATALMAWFIFHESFNRRIALGMILLVAGAAALAWTGTPTLAGVIGPAAIIGACVMWGLDNNLTRKVSLADPLQIVQLKGLLAGPFNSRSGCGPGLRCPGRSMPCWPASSVFSAMASASRFSWSRSGTSVRRAPAPTSRPPRSSARWSPSWRSAIPSPFNCSRPAA